MSEIKIDGVDVSECGFYYKDDCHCELNRDNRIYTMKCKSADCYYKQLKRLEQENKELKEKVEQLENKLQLRTASDKESDEYWDEIFSEKDYPFNKENAYKELSDYYFVLNQLPSIYMEITGGRLSKTTYFASSVIEAYNDSIQEYWDKIDDFETAINQYKTALEEIREMAKYDCIHECSNNKENCTIGSCLEKRIQRKVDEVLK